MTAPVRAFAASLALVAGCGSRTTLVGLEPPLDSGAADAAADGEKAATTVHDANAAPDCAEGLVTLASRQRSPQALAVDAENVYWSDTDDPKALFKVARCGGPAVLLARGYDLSEFSIALDATNAYWENESAILKTPLGGGNTTTLASPEVYAASIVVHGLDVFWRTGSLAPSMGSIMHVPIAGGTATTLVTGLDSPGGLAIDGADVYWASYYSGVVSKMPLAGGAEVTLFSGDIGPDALVVDADSVYWTDVHAGLIVKVGRDGGTAVTLATRQGPVGIATDGHSVYWTNLADCPGRCAGSIMKVPSAGGMATTLVSDQDGPIAIAVDTTSVYWVNESGDGGGTVRKFTPK